MYIRIIYVGGKYMSQSKLAYIFGNDNYINKHFPKLSGAVNDAKLMKETLDGCGFETYQFTNLKYNDLCKKIKEFKDKCNENKVCLFYYAGHGFEYQGNNYLCPIDAQLNNFIGTNVNISDLVNEVSKDRGFVCIVILDCCRTIVECGGRGLDGRSPITADFKNRGGTFVAYATSSDSEAFEDNGNGLYTKLLCGHIAKDNKPIEQIFKAVRKELIDCSEKCRESNNKQISWEYSSLVDEFYFKEEDAGLEMISSVKDVVKKSYSFDMIKKYVDEYCFKNKLVDEKAVLRNFLKAIDNYVMEGDK